MGKLSDLTGLKFGRLTVIQRSGTKNGHVAWLCKCDCGKTIVTIGNLLKSGKSKSCGCKKIETCGDTHRVHGKSNTRLYIAWQHMKQRCCNTQNDRYKYYGGRGISICDDWMQFEPFEQWALSNGYEDELTIDRIDVNGDYCPENCRWVTWETQQNNKRNNNIIEAFGEKRTLAEWSKISGVNRTTIQKRINVCGQTPEKAMNH